MELYHADSHRMYTYDRNVEKWRQLEEILDKCVKISTKHDTLLPLDDDTTKPNGWLIKS